MQMFSNHNVFVNGKIFKQADILEGTGNTHLRNITGTLTGNIYLITTRSSIFHLALRGSVNTGNHIEGCSLTCAVRADKRYNLMFLNINFEFVYSGYAAKTHSNRFSFQNGAHCLAPF